MPRHRLMNNIFNKKKPREDVVHPKHPPSASQPDCRATETSIPQAASPIIDQSLTQNQQEPLHNHVYPSVNASGNSNLILGNVHEVHYHIPPQVAHAREQLLSSLHFREMFRRYENIDDPHSDTFTWVLQPPADVDPEYHSFLKWLHSDQSLFWVSGKPGSGKSVLMKYLSQNVKKSLNCDEASVVVLSFWFWEAAQQELERSLIGCLRSLLWQMLQTSSQNDSIFGAIEYNLHFEWTKQRLSQAVKAALETLLMSRMEVFVLLDGLDETGSDASELLQFVRNISNAFPTVKFAISSRPEPIFQQSLAVYPHLKMQNLNRPDIESIVRQNLLEAPDFASFTDQEVELERLESDLVYGAEGVLLWVRIVVRDLLVYAASGDTLTELMAHLNRLPAELNGEDGLFAFMLRRNAAYSKNYLAEAAFYLQIACHKTMSLLQFCLATNGPLRNGYLSFHKGWEDLHLQLDCDRLSRAISTRTCGLLEVTEGFYSGRLYDRAAQTRSPALTQLLNKESYRHVQFVHRAARSFILETKTGQDLLAVYAGTASDIDQICFEAHIIDSFQLRCLESIAPLGIRTLTEIPRPEFGSTLEKLKVVLKELTKGGYIWTEPYRTRWIGRISRFWHDFDLPWPTLTTSETDISFAHAFAHLEWVRYVAETIERDNLSKDPDYLSSIFATLRSDIHFRVRDHAGRKQLYERFASYSFDPQYESVNMFGERICLINEQFDEDTKEHESILSGSVITEKITQLKFRFRCTQYHTTMINCSRLFFRPSHTRSISLLGGMCSEEANLWIQLCDTTDKNIYLKSLDAQLAVHSKDNDFRILCFWDYYAWKPHMCAIAAKNSLRVMSELIPVSDLEQVSAFVGEMQFHFHHYSSEMEATIMQQQEVKSLLEAFRLLDKSKASIEAFLAVEGPRIQRTYDEVIYGAWLSWIYGTEETPSSVWHRIPRPEWIRYSVQKPLQPA